MGRPQNPAKEGDGGREEVLLLEQMDSPDENELVSKFKLVGWHHLLLFASCDRPETPKAVARKVIGG
jgi:hypothetical protein